MQITAAQKKRVALFFIFGVVLFVLLIAVLVGNRVLKREKCYHTLFEDISVAGLSEGSGVKFQGMDIGQVRAISILPENTAVIKCEFCLKPGVPIKQGTYSSLGNIGITGLKFIELQGGGTGNDIEEGGLIPSKKSSWDEITGKATVITNKVESILNETNRLVKAIDPNMAPNIMKNIADITLLGRKYLEENGPQINVTLLQLQRVAIQLEKTLKSAENSLNSINTLAKESLIAVKNTQKATKRIEDMLSPKGVVSRTLLLTEEAAKQVVKSNITDSFKRINEVFDEINKTIKTVNLLLLRSQEEIITSFESLSEGMEYFSEFSRTIMENPSAILRGKEETK